MEWESFVGWPDANPEQVAQILKDVALERDPYHLDMGQVFLEYKELITSTIVEFSFNYSLGWHAQQECLDNIASKQALFLLIRDYLREMEGQQQ